MAALYELVRSESDRFEQAEIALRSGRPSIFNVSIDKRLSNPWDFPPSFANYFAPASTKRNFFVIHEHDATAYHWDLRLQCSYVHNLPGTISWAVVKGFHDFNQGEKRLAVQTPLHSIGYSVFEGVSPPYGSTLICDFGTYSIKTSASALSKGKDREQSTPEPASSDEVEMEGKEEEKALTEGFRKHAFVIELRGIRFHMRIAMTFRQGEHKPRGGGQKRSWLATLAPSKSGEYLYVDRMPDMTNHSILTGRSMKEIRRIGGSVYPRREAPIPENLEGLLE